MEDRHLCKKKLVDQEYETQFFGFSSQTMIDVVRGVVAGTTKDAAEALAKKISEHMKKSKPEDVQAAADLLIKEYEEATKDSLHMWEEAMQRHFHIPSHVLLEEDEPQRQQFSAAEASTVDDELTNLTRRAKRAALLDSFLSAQLEAVRNIRQRLEDCKTRLGSDEATHDLKHRAWELSACAQAFASKTDTLEKKDLQRVRRKEADNILRPRSNPDHHDGRRTP